MEPCRRSLTGKQNNYTNKPLHNIAANSRSFVWNDAVNAAPSGYRRFLSRRRYKYIYLMQDTCVCVCGDYTPLLLKVGVYRYGPCRG